MGAFWVASLSRAFYKSRQLTGPGLLKPIGESNGCVFVSFDLMNEAGNEGGFGNEPGFILNARICL